MNEDNTAFENDLIVVFLHDTSEEFGQIVSSSKVDGEYVYSIMHKSGNVHTVDSEIIRLPKRGDIYELV